MSVWTTSHGIDKPDGYWIWHWGWLRDADAVKHETQRLILSTWATDDDESWGFKPLDAKSKVTEHPLAYRLLDMDYAPRAVQEFFDTGWIEGTVNPISNHASGATWCSLKDSLKYQYYAIYPWESPPESIIDGRCT